MEEYRQKGEEQILEDGHVAAEAAEVTTERSPGEEDLLETGESTKRDSQRIVPEMTASHHATDGGPNMHRLSDLYGTREHLEEFQKKVPPTEDVAAATAAPQVPTAMDKISCTPIERYPQSLAADLKELALEVSSWVSAQAQKNVAEADACADRISSSTIRQRMVADGPLDEYTCHQIQDIAQVAGALVLCEAFELQGRMQIEEDFRLACDPKPLETSAGLWQETHQLFTAAARLACAQVAELAVVDERQHRFIDCLRSIGSNEDG